MRLKKGANPFGVRPEIVLALMVVDTLFRKHGIDLWGTSINDGRHSRTSFHYDGKAVDIRIWGIYDPAAMVEEIKDWLGSNPDYDVILEKDHIHIEYQPKYRR